MGAPRRAADRPGLLRATWTQPPRPSGIGFEWKHPLGDVVSALAGAGLRIEMLHEYDFTVSPGWELLRRSSDRSYRLPEGVPLLPLMYLLLATCR